MIRLVVSLLILTWRINHLQLIKLFFPITLPFYRFNRGKHSGLLFLFKLFKELDVIVDLIALKAPLGKICPRCFNGHGVQKTLIRTAIRWLIFLKQRSGKLFKGFRQPV